MSRRIGVVWPKAQAATGVPPVGVDTYFDKVVKYIPTDIVAAWVAVWAFALGGPFQHVPGREVYGSLLLILYTLVLALINPKEG